MITLSNILTMNLLLGATLLFAQKKNTYFLKNSGQYVSKLDSADFIRVVREPAKGSTLYTVYEFYPKGQEKMEGTSTTIDPINLEGTCISFYINGKRKSVVDYKHNRVVGESLYFPNGNLNYTKFYGRADSVDRDKNPIPQSIYIKACRDSTDKVLAANGEGYFVGYTADFGKIAEEGKIKNGKPVGEWKGYEPIFKTKILETYGEDGQLKTGLSINSFGQRVSYYSRMVPPRYIGGMAAFNKFLSKNISYPAAARADHIQGTVMLMFLVGKDGSMKDIKVFRSVNNLVNAEAMRVIKLSDGSWLPGSVYGRAVDYPLTVPISFNLVN